MEGWNQDKLQGVLDVLDDINNLEYELKNCVRGCQTGAHTYKELQDFINQLADRLHNEAEWLDDVEEDEDEDEIDPDCRYFLRKDFY